MDSTHPLFTRYLHNDLELETPRVLIRPLQASDFDAFIPLTTIKETWKYFYKDLGDADELKKWLADSLKEKEQGTRMPMTIIDKDTRQVCGSSSYGNISFYDKRIEIGWSWLGPEFIGMGINKHVKFALISYAFEVLKMERIEAKTDALNERAKAGLLKVGMIPEGILRSHTLMPGGRRRDTIYFSILRSEWDERRKSFFGEMI